MKEIKTNDGKKGGWLVGKRHYDKSGKSLGGIKAVVTDAGDKPVELEGGEVIINREASKKYWKELSKINQSAGNGVAIGPPSGFDEDPEDNYENGGKIDFNPNHIPNKWILSYAEKIKANHPEIWKLGGNIFGNEAFNNLKRVADRGHWLDSEEWMYIKWRAYVARHQRDYRIEGVVAMLKWVDKVEKGWPYMKQLIEEKINKIESKKKGWKHKTTKMKTGGSVDNPSKSFVIFFKSKMSDEIIYVPIEDSSISVDEAIERQRNLYSWMDIKWIKGFEVNKGTERLELFLENIKDKWETNPDLSVKIKNGQIVFSKGKDSVTFDVAILFKIVSTSEKSLTMFNRAHMTNGNTEIIVDDNFNFDKNKVFELILNKMNGGGSVAQTPEQKIDNLPKGKMFEDAKNIESVFKRSSHTWSEVIELFEKNRNKGQYEIVNLSDIKITQPNIQSNKAKKIISNIDKTPIINVIEFNNGEKVIFDGHHRLIANWAIGNSKIKVNLVKAQNNNIFKDGGRTIGQTPAPKKDQIKGSDVNKSGSSATTKSASSIKFDEKTIESINNKVKEHNDAHPDKKITLASAKAVVRRGMGAYSSSHRPTITGGKPNSRVAWGIARLNAFTYKIVHGKSKSGKYTQDDDLINELGYSVAKYHLGGDMSKHLAPNGKPSNLTHEQWHLVRTPEFKAWFGDWENDSENSSKVIDENGEPLICYHGTYVENPFYIFDFDKADLGFHFGTYEQAKNRSETKLFFKGRKSIVNSFFLNIKTIFESSDIGEWEYPQRYIDMFVSDALISESDAKKNGFYRLIQREENKQIREYLLNKYGKFVGFVYNNKYEGKGKSFIVLNSTQIKLADGTNTTFDGDNPDIRFERGGQTEKQHGDCYVVAGKIAMGSKKIDFIGTPYLVHAQVEGQGTIKGIKYGHAWVEDDIFVYDYSNGRELVVPKKLYYAMGNIKQIKPQYYKYTFNDAMTKMIETQHYGSWDLQTESGL